ncbi:hypothetical protein DESUT3_30480 [Desulfuromonas versatilis]|uniref:PDZ domain-containing protein n=1 Tax=Desulfuromonas versatilis TaxID=2802975 RepID=A0ABM8HVN0_9BACT|nr:type II secretion system protein GspC [Desulfuromonas versatilis]BCR05979.1 hypothetical protein DESUT3_30480 [Desulfuromonas versatilis]
MLSFIQRYFRGIYLLLFSLLGLSLGGLTATGLGVLLSPPIRFDEGTVREAPAPTRKASLSDYQVVLQRNIFDSTGQGVQSLAPAPQPDQPAERSAGPRTSLTLLGTVAAGPDSLALIRAGNEGAIYRLEDEVPGGGKVSEITRSLVKIQYPDGSVEVLQLFEPAGGSAPGAASAPGPTGAAESGEGIREVGENRWEIAQSEVEKARGNINELLKQARMEPNIVDGRTEGFVVRMIQRNSLLAKLGIRRGDVVMQVNGVELDSPEKALQIFQQLREARNISIGLTRNGEPMNFEYDIN